MALLDCEITTPKAVHLNILLANGKSINVPAGATMRYQLTGDELGRTEGSLEAGRKAAKREGALDSEVLGGGIQVLSPGYYDPPAVGTKKHRLANPDEYDSDGNHKAKAEKPLKAPKSAKKSE